jgi:mannitol-1-phosphate/altronate dehydrogenase
VSNDRQSLILRTQEIVSRHPEGITSREAYKQALLERYKNDPAGMADHAATLAVGTLSQLRKRTYELPPEDPSLPLAIPQWIGIRTDEGDLLVARDEAELGQVRQWAREAESHHSTQKLRIKRFRERLDTVKDEPDALPWWSAKNLILSIEEAPSGE